MIFTENNSHLFNLKRRNNMPTEMEVWSLFWQAGLTNAVYFTGLAFLLWVSFRAANMAGESDNMIGKVFVTVFCFLHFFLLFR